MAHHKTEYENYILVSAYTKTLGGTYQRFVKFKGLMSSLNLMSQKQSNSYTYNGETYVSKLTASEVNKIQSALDYGTYNSSIEKLKYIFSDIGDRLF